jgi:hypothetical protein
MILKRNRIGGLVFGTLVLSTCFLVACAVGEEPPLNPATGGSGQSSGSAGSATSGAAHGGSTGTAGTSAGGASAGTAAGGGTSGGDKGGDGGSGSDGTGGKDGGTGGKGGGAGSGGNGGSATGGVGGAAGAGGTGGGGTGGTAGAGAGTTVNIDLSTYQPVSAGSYSAANQTLAVVAQLYFQFQLPKAFATGQSVAVHVTGTNNGTAGLRSWLVDGSQATLSNMVTTYVGPGLVSGSFTLDYTLTATDSAEFLFFKGPTFSTNIDDVTISAITVTY